MWIFLKDAFLSIVVPTVKDCPQVKKNDLLVVRARRKGEIQAVFPNARVQAWKGRDYSFRAFIPRAIVAEEMAEQVLNMSATNFKSSVLDTPRHDAYMDVWSVMWAYQNGDYHKPKKIWRFQEHDFGHEQQDDLFYD